MLAFRTASAKLGSSVSFLGTVPNGCASCAQAPAFAQLAETHKHMTSAVFFLVLAGACQLPNRHGVVVVVGGFATKFVHPQKHMAPP